MADEFESVPLESIPVDAQGKALQDLYVHLPSSGRYIRFIPAGEEVEASKIESVKLHPVPLLYQKRLNPGAPAPTETRAPDPEIPKEFQEKILGKALKDEMEETYKFIKGDAADSGIAIKRFEAMSDNLVGAIAPDVKAMSSHLKRQAQYLALMSDVAAISTLSIICAFANGFDSRKSYRELSYATLVMDIALTEFSEEQLKLYYTDRDKLPPDVLKNMLLHPMKSYQLAEQKLKSLSDITMQLILNHHELFNGKGYPRGVRTEALFPIARVLSLAVDAFERLKKEEFLKSKKSLVDIFTEFRDEHSEAHMRRHNKKFVDGVITFLSKEGDVPLPG